MMRAPPSQESTIFCASWSWGPAAGPRGVNARRPFEITAVSRPGSPRKNLLAGRSKILASCRYSRKARRSNSGSGIGTSSAMAAAVEHGEVRQRESRVKLSGLDQMKDGHPLDNAVRDILFARPEADG